MTNLKMAMQYLRSRLLVTILTVSSVALGLALATIVLILSEQTKDNLKNEIGYWDVVIGAKGSKLQLVLNSLYYLDAPTGNVSVDIWHHLEEDQTVSRIIPLSMGDNYNGSPIIGTSEDFFNDRQQRNPQQKVISKGKIFQKPFEAVVGADVASRNNLKLGEKIVSAHGWGNTTGDKHPDNPYTIVGILARSGSSIDRALYTDYHSTWLVHAHHHHDGDQAAPADEHAVEHAAEHEHKHEHTDNHEVTALLVRLKQPTRRFTFVDEITKTLPAMAAVPVDEIRLLDHTLIAPLQRMLLLVSYMVVFVSALSILISLYLSIHQRRRDIAILRSLGATQGDIFRLITLEAAILAGLGVIIGSLIGHILIAITAPTISEQYGVLLQAWRLQGMEIGIGISVWLLGILAGLLPAIMAYRLPVADTLTRE